MHFSSHNINIRRYTRAVLVLFVLSVLNLGVQIPAHAAMKMQMQEMNHDMMSMTDCHCPPSFCDSILALDDQSVDGVSGVQVFDNRATAKLIEVLDQNAGQLNLYQHYARNQLAAAETAAPPLLIKTLLLI